MLNRSEKRSTIFPFPSSPHCAPRMMMLLMRAPRAHVYEEIPWTYSRWIGSKPLIVSRSRARVFRSPAEHVDWRDTLEKMHVSDIFVALGDKSFEQMLR